MSTISARVAVNVYGMAQGSPPFGSGLSSPTRIVNWDTPVSMNFPTQGTVFHPVSPGIQVGGSSNYIYSIIEILPTGLTLPGHGDKYTSNQSVATLATNSTL